MPVTERLCLVEETECNFEHLEFTIHFMQDEQTALAGFLEGQYQKFDQLKGEGQASGAKGVARELGHPADQIRPCDVPVAKMLQERKLSGTAGGGVHGIWFEKVISIENLCAAWREFTRGKRWKSDVLSFGMNIEEEIISLHQALEQGTYTHGPYTHFTVSDPKPRAIHKASVRDRLLHHAIHRIIEPWFERRFIYDTYASRSGKGTHAAVKRFEWLAWKLCRNRTRTVWVLQCDVKKFFASVDHATLKGRLERVIHDDLLMKLLSNGIESFEVSPGKGIPLGNLTSQLYANVYLDQLDQYIKRVLRVPAYLRYADDMLLAHTDREVLLSWYVRIERFLITECKLVLHPHKTTLRPWHQGIDFLGYVSFPTHRVLRTRTKWRLLRRISTANASSYLGVTLHVRALLPRMCAMLYFIHARRQFF